MKKLLFLASSIATSGGIQRSLSLITKGLSHMGYSITIISLFDYEKTHYDFDENIIVIKGSLRQNTDLKKNFFSVYKECNRLISSIDYDVLIIEGLGLVPFVGNKHLDKRNKKNIVCDHTGLNNFNKFGLSWFGLVKTRKKADYLLVLTDGNLKEYGKYFLNAKCKVLFIPNPLDPKVKKGEYKIESKKFCFAGRLSIEKGVDMLIEAAKNIFEKEKYWEWRLEIFGEGPEGKKLEYLIQKYNLGENIKIRGYNPDIYDDYINYSFLVVPSRFESFGLIIIEALKSGIPVVSFNCPYGPKQLIKNEKNGLLVEESNIQELSNAIERMITEDELRMKLANNTNEYLDEYEFDNVIDQWVALFGDEVK